MERRTLITVLSLLWLAFAENAAAQSLPSSLPSLSNPLMSTLMKSLGVTQNQAEGGVGSILTLAKEKLAKGDFDKIAAVIPGASKYLEKAKSLGAVAGPLVNAAGLNGALAKLGIDAATAAKFIPAVTSFVGKAGGSRLGALLGSALK
ncbi:MAG TPA: DUF2780 domain-containing protein [Steroidobacteraceae bacterium]|nr:DUF2780 domain-containing protein [Steroidobacteraceae bacterium]